jgi:hypothetical protein
MLRESVGMDVRLSTVINGIETHTKRHGIVSNHVALIRLHD